MKFHRNKTIKTNSPILGVTLHVAGQQVPLGRGVMAVGAHVRVPLGRRGRWFLPRRVTDDLHHLRLLFSLFQSVLVVLVELVHLTVRIRWLLLSTIFLVLHDEHVLELIVGRLVLSNDDLLVIFGLELVGREENLLRCARRRWLLVRLFDLLEGINVGLNLVFLFNFDCSSGFRHDDGLAMLEMDEKISLEAVSRD